MKRHPILIVLAIALTAWAYTSISNGFKRGAIQNPGSLRAAILASINNPFKQADTFILDTRWIICGNTSPDEMPVIFNTCIDSSGYKNKLAAQLHMPVLTNSEFDRVMDTVKKYRFNGEYPASLWDSCRAGKVIAAIQAEQLTTTKVRVHEYYRYNSYGKAVEKEFILKNGKWVWSVVEESL